MIAIFMDSFIQEPHFFDSLLNEFLCVVTHFMIINLHVFLSLFLISFEIGSELYVAYSN